MHIVLRSRFPPACSTLPIMAARFMALHPAATQLQCVTACTVRLQQSKCFWLLGQQHTAGASPFAVSATSPSSTSTSGSAECKSSSFVIMANEATSNGRQRDSVEELSWQGKLLHSFTTCPVRRVQTNRLLFGVLSSEQGAPSRCRRAGDEPVATALAKPVRLPLQL